MYKMHKEFESESNSLDDIKLRFFWCHAAGVACVSCSMSIVVPNFKYHTFHVKKFVSNVTLAVSTKVWRVRTLFAI